MHPARLYSDHHQPPRQRWFLPDLPDALASDRKAHLLRRGPHPCLGRRTAICGARHRVWIALDHLSDSGRPSRFCGACRDTPGES